MKSKAKNDKRKKEIEAVFGESQVMMLVEDMRDDFNSLADGQVTLGHRMDRLGDRFDGLGKRFDCLEIRFDGLETRFDGLETRFTAFETWAKNFEIEVRDNFKVVLEYLGRIDDEIVDIKKELARMKKNEIEDKKWKEAMEKRLLALEDFVQKHRKVLTKNRA